MLTTNTLDKVSGVEVLTAACAACKETVEKQGGRLMVKEAARAVTERDDRLLTEQLTALEAANRSVAALLRSHGACNCWELMVARVRINWDRDGFNRAHDACEANVSVIQAYEPNS